MERCGCSPVAPPTPVLLTCWYAGGGRCFCRVMHPCHEGAVLPVTYGMAWVLLAGVYCRLNCPVHLCGAMAWV